ncbi:Mut7-C RNAse domain-containing protein, partial [Salinispira pacifica]
MDRETAGPLHQATFRFYEELNDFLPEERRKREITYRFHGHPAVKDSIEALGVPHTEVDLIIVTGAAGEGVSVDFAYQLAPGDRVAVYPVFEGFDLAGTSRLRPEPLREIRFVLDVHLGKLARILRLLGFDSFYRNHQDDAQIAFRAAREHRIVLTRDQGLLKRSIVSHGYWLRSQDPEEQAVEVIRRFDLARLVKPLTRCPVCNEELEPVARETVYHLVPP